ncbi:hypothetical protein AX774_g4767 [Zancudomyces culisetae]|uniref:CCHC-type domain-containing protein n=1 Tax=Zancudomyces culisetae TaxID=1213189 RepID=A0A1R1PLF8_ZANCU|nr:hypothetical protein AX774_g7360 [Zancudomyces culisetae]OMH81777.1 hypothetical protein AX774_g4767 [Zancudomyces culisetae]|eukprot:OMH79230.1 hypothetical protein AX774_g7360 [Zancudomyces culisetae]
MTRYTARVKKAYLPSSNFEGKELVEKKSAGGITKRKFQNGGGRSFGADNNDRGRFGGGKRYIHHNNKKMLMRDVVCFGCRKSGHTLRECTEKNGSGESNGGVLCYHCGDTSHTSKACSALTKEFKFATCFVCNQTGHLSSKCPENTANGIYPNGGTGCGFCSSKEHLARDCEQNPKNMRKTKRVEDPLSAITSSNGNHVIGTIRSGQGADDDEVFDRLNRVSNLPNNSGHDGRNDASGSGSGSGSASRGDGPKKRKVVKF